MHNQTPARLAAAWILAAASIVAPLTALGVGMPKVAAVSASATPAGLTRGHSGQLVIRLQIATGFHVNSAKPNDPDLIATAFVPSSSADVHFGAAKYPKAVMIKEAGSAQAIQVYIGAVSIVVPFTLTPTAKAGSMTVGGKLTYQGCNATSCYPPVTDAVSANVTVK